MLFICHYPKKYNKNKESLCILFYNKWVFSLDSITMALQTASQLSQQAELGGILEEIEVNFKTTTRWCCLTIFWFIARNPISSKGGPIVFTYGFIFLFFDTRRIALHDVKLQLIKICVALGLGTASLFKWGILASFWLASFYNHKVWTTDELSKSVISSLSDSKESGVKKTSEVWTFDSEVLLVHMLTLALFNKSIYHCNNIHDRN